LHDSVCFIRAGSAHVERKNVGQGIVVATLRAGDVFGEMSFLDGMTASGSVVADEELLIDLVDRAQLLALLAADTAFAAHLYRSLAATMATRLRNTLDQLPVLFVEDVPQVNRFHTQRASLGDPEEVSDALSDVVAEVKSRLFSVDLGLLDGSWDPEAAQVYISDGLDSFKEVLQKEVPKESEESDQWGAYAFREMFPFLMQSALIDRAFAKPRGYAGDYWTIQLMQRSEPQGAGRLGPLIDNWFLGIPSVRAVRNRQARMTELIGQVASALGEAPCAVTSVASGPAEELFELFRASEAPFVTATCLDIDPEALSYCRTVSDHLGVGDRMTLIQENAVHLALGKRELNLPLQNLIYSVGLTEYLEDDLVVPLLKWVRGHLMPGGSVVLGNFNASCPDRAFNEHILEWHLIYRTPDDLRRVMQAAGFSASEVRVESDETGVQLLAIASRSS
jgi:CRP-like cAMP-binding protein